jgi:hypothetical protein
MTHVNGGRDTCHEWSLLFEVLGLKWLPGFKGRCEFLQSELIEIYEWKNLKL